MCGNITARFELGVIVLGSFECSGSTKEMGITSNIHLVIRVPPDSVIYCLGLRR